MRVQRFASEEVSGDIQGSYVLLVSNSGWYLYNFRLPLIRTLIGGGYKLGLVAPHDKYTKMLEKEGVTVHDWVVSRRSLNPLREANALFDLLRIYRREKPDLVHHFTIKACLYGTIAAKGARVYRVINAVTGLGHVFIATGKRSRLLRKLVKPLYRAAFKARRSTVVFQNADDQEKMIRLGIADSEKACLIRGSGVDIEYFKPKEDSAGRFHKPVKILFPSRLIREKGICELLEACNRLWAEGIDIELVVAGELDLGNRSALSSTDLSAIQAKQHIKLLGHVTEMREMYAECDIVVLPSWREGLSKALVEAAAMERPVITTDVPGCRDVVDHARSGLLVPLRNARAIELAIRLLINQPTLARSFGKEARQKVVAEFQVTMVNTNTVSQYEMLLSKKLLRTRC